MRYLIDGYNLMYAAGLLGKRLGPDRFRKVRTRFLNDLAAALGPIDSAATTVVFDAAAAPDHVPDHAAHQGISVIFAVDVESADDQIEQLIAEHSAPRKLTVVSSDRRLRTAATRRKAQALTADAFLIALDARKSGRSAPPAAPEPSRDALVSPAESSFWLREFGDLDDQPETKQALGTDSSLLTDAEIAAIEREVDAEPD